VGIAELWFTEKQTPNLALSTKIKRIYVQEKTEIQELAMVETEAFGNMLILDGVIMTTERDEFVYHEMMAHPALVTHPNPERVLVVGGGDGGVIREILKHPKVKKVTLVDIDGKVIEYSKQYLPTIACKLDDPRVEVLVKDGFLHIHESKNLYDVILADTTDPIGQAARLFPRGFYHGIHEALREDGLFVAQTEDPWFNAELIARIHRDVRDAFPIVRHFWANVPTYPTGMWTFTMGSKKYDPLEVDISTIPDLDTKYYTPQIHRAAFVLPKFVADIVKD